MSEYLTGIERLPVVPQAGKQNTLPKGEFRDLLKQERAKTSSKGKEPAPAPEEAKRLMNVCFEFEAFFISQLLSKLRTSVLPEGEGLFQSKEEEYLRGMLDVEQGRALARRGAMGIAGLLYRQMEHLLPRAEIKESQVSPSSLPPAAPEVYRLVDTE